MKYYDEENTGMRTLGSMGAVADPYFEAKKARFNWDLNEYPLIGEGERVAEEALV